MSSTTKPVTILTGFLGAGKTTFLNHLLDQNKETRYAIIENEFGEQGIDSELVVRPDETIVELNSGCLCCTLNENLYDILNDLYQRSEEFDEVIIEATGVADPTGLAQPFISHQLIKKHFPLKGVVCLVDAELIDIQIAETEEAKNQVAYSDVLLVNKTDLVSPERLDELKERLHTQNPLASIVFGNREAFPFINLAPEKSPLDELFEHSHHHHTDEQFPVKKPHHHHHHKHTEEIVSQTFHFDQPFDYNMLDRQLFVYLMLQAEDLYRMKGLVWFEGFEEQYVIQSVGKRLDIEKKNTWQANEPKKSVIVFIGKNLQRKGLERLLTKCLSKRNSTLS
ncbi:MAG: GTP-binding protein [Bacteroidota bacterium]